MLFVYEIFPGISEKKNFVNRFTFAKIMILFFLRQCRLENLHTARIAQIGVGDEVNPDELMDMASEPHENNVYIVSNYSGLTLDVGNRLINAVCDSEHFCQSISIIIGLILFFQQCDHLPQMDRATLYVMRLKFCDLLHNMYK